jgi:hypothetical protein
MKRLQFLLRKDGKLWKMKHAVRRGSLTRSPAAAGCLPAYQQPARAARCPRSRPAPHPLEYRHRAQHYFEPPSIRRVRIKESRDTQFRMMDIQKKLRYIQMLRDRGM